MNATPNREYNVKWQTLPVGKFRHRDHRFEWTRAELQDWANRVAARFGYNVRFLPVGPEAVGSPTQMGCLKGTVNPNIASTKLKGLKSRKKIAQGKRRETSAALGLFSFRISALPDTLPENE